MADANHYDSAIITRPDSGESIEQVNLLNKLLEWLHEGEGSTPEVNWRTESEEDYDYYAGKQDTSEVLEKLSEQNRPALVYNTILPKINMLCGLAAQSNRVPYLFPVSGEDSALVEVMNGAFKHYRRKANVKRVENECFEHSSKSGRSFLYYYIGGENPFKPEIKCKRLPGRDVILDPLSKEYDLSDARYVFIDKWLCEEDVKALFPQLNPDEIKTLSGASTDMPTFYNDVTNKYRITECWYREYKMVLWFQNPLTGQAESASPVQFQRFVQALSEGIPGPDGRLVQYNEEIKPIPRMAKKVMYAIFSGNKVIEQGETPYQRQEFPVFLFGAYKDEDENRWFSVINMMKDPQKGRNTMRRQLLHLLNTAPKGILIHEVDALINEDEWDARSSEPNFRLILNKGSIDKYRFSNQPQINPIYAQLDTVFEQDIKDTSGVQDSLLGIQTSSREPGVTVRMRQETGMAVLYILFDNFRESRINSAKFFLSLIQQYVTQQELIRIEGQEGVQMMQINTQTNPQMPGFNDISAGDYDLVVDEAVENQTMRMAVAQMLTEFAQNNPGSVPPDLILEYSDMPLSARIKVQQYQQMMMAREDEKFRMEQETQLKIAEMKSDTDIVKTKMASKDRGKETKNKREE